MKVWKNVVYSISYHAAITCSDTKTLSFPSKSVSISIRPEVRRANLKSTTLSLTIINKTPYTPLERTRYHSVQNLFFFGRGGVKGVLREPGLRSEHIWSSHYTHTVQWNLRNQFELVLAIYGAHVSNAFRQLSRADSVKIRVNLQLQT